MEANSQSRRKDLTLRRKKIIPRYRDLYRYQGDNSGDPNADT